MCIDFEYELDWDLKCERCNQKPAVDLRDPTGEDREQEVWDGYKAICEKCGLEMYGENIVSEWAGTEIYLKNNPDMVKVWR